MRNFHSARINAPCFYAHWRIVMYPRSLNHLCIKNAWKPYMTASMMTSSDVYHMMRDLLLSIAARKTENHIGQTSIELASTKNEARNQTYSGGGDALSTCSRAAPI